MKRIIALGAAAILLIDASCLAEKATAWLPNRNKCLDLLELERIRWNPQTNTMTIPDAQLGADYYAVAGWVQGYFTAQNLSPNVQTDIVKGNTVPQMLTWIFSYCRAHPSSNLLNATTELITALVRDKK